MCAYFLTYLTFTEIILEIKKKGGNKKMDICYFNSTMEHNDFSKNGFNVTLL